MIKAAAYNCEALQNPFIFDEVYSLISPQRREHVDEAKTLKGKCERLGAAHLLEKLLWENHIQRPYVYSTTSQGKPIFIQPKNVDFSISHSNFFAVAAISDKPVGIDVERIRPYDRDLVQRFFTKADYEYLESFKRSEVNKKFTEVWTFKEATCKMMDRPLMQVLQWIDFSEYCDQEKGKIYWTKQGFEFRDYYITLCYEDKRQPIQMGLYNPYDGKYY
ncbi:4'-phosphopantetheinyl transferase [Pseudobutyrivibrio sp. OR37]|uniref:4'-phosphopantetheinyl transferase family protein n=1 Tax=Pseudobutyrivibrio sp. OR37 TaxID=1798186 RepID=UPI0008DED8F9|nr:4'-phosphopantetheinyl transferase superfamily protein [Pseudobutyrivibrio sp. OR37]SFI01243.1 4'-phosphopantetheinyl transferase [Pseudobutyrivibrio sp. OR37]